MVTLENTFMRLSNFSAHKTLLILCSNGKDNYQKKRRKYDESFKEELLKMVKSGRSVAEVSRIIDLGENLLYKWKSEENHKKC